MEVVLGFAVGYYIGTRQGRKGLAEAIESAQAIMASPETRRFLSEAINTFETVAGPAEPALRPGGPSWKELEEDIFTEDFLLTRPLLEAIRAQESVVLLVDEDDRVMIGATLAGAGVGELIHAATVAVAGQVPLDLLWHAVPSYPTMSEIWLRLLEAHRS